MNSRVAKEAVATLRHLMVTPSKGTVDAAILFFQHFDPLDPAALDCKLTPLIALADAAKKFVELPDYKNREAFVEALKRVHPELKLPTVEKQRVSDSGQ